VDCLNDVDLLVSMLYVVIICTNWRLVSVGLDLESIGQQAEDIFGGRLVHNNNILILLLLSW